MGNQARTQEGYASVTNNTPSSGLRQQIAGAGETLELAQAPGDVYVVLAATDATATSTLLLLDPGARNSPPELLVTVADATGTVQLRGANDDTTIQLLGAATAASNTNPVELTEIGEYTIRYVNVSDVTPNAGFYIVSASTP